MELTIGNLRLILYFLPQVCRKPKHWSDENQIDNSHDRYRNAGRKRIAASALVSENYPDIVCILLTSHADFSYAQESIKLGCFDYVVQPAPYQEIEDALLRAIAKVHTEAEKNQYYKDGLFYTNHKQELTDRTILNLFFPESCKPPASTAAVKWDPLSAISTVLHPLNLHWYLSSDW